MGELETTHADGFDWLPEGCLPEDGMLLVHNGNRILTEWHDLVHTDKVFWLGHGTGLIELADLRECGICGGRGCRHMRQKNALKLHDVGPMSAKDVLEAFDIQWDDEIQDIKNGLVSL